MNQKIFVSFLANIPELIVEDNDTMLGGDQCREEVSTVLIFQRMIIGSY